MIRFNKNKKYIIGAAGFVVIIVFVGILSSYHILQRYTESLNTITIEDIDITGVPDGVYRGRSSVYLLDAEVSVRVEEGMITRIAIESPGRRKPMGADDIIKRILNSQSLAVDTVTGATGTSLVVLDAVQKAISGSAGSDATGVEAD